LLYGESGGESSDGERRTGASPTDTTDDDIIVPAPDSEIENDRNEKRKREDGTAFSSSSSSSFDTSIKHDATGGVQRSTGPHFTIHDATGQRYVCRAYAEDELIVRSRIDSVFNPVITIWDDVEHEMGENRVGDDGDGPAKVSVDNGKEQRSCDRTAFISTSRVD
jgi:hypothetical protein